MGNIGRQTGKQEQHDNKTTDQNITIKLWFKFEIGKVKLNEMKLKETILTVLSVVINIVFNFHYEYIYKHVLIHTTYGVYFQKL